MLCPVGAVPDEGREREAAGERVVATVNLIDESFVVAAPARVAAELHDRRRWPQMWPDLTLRVFQDRGDSGIRWNVGGALVGSMEVWLEPHADGTIVHHYLRADLARPASPRSSARETRRRQRHAKALFWALKDRLEGDRRPGEPVRRAEPAR